MLFLLSEEVLDLLAELFKDRFMNRQGNDDNPVWSTHVVSLIAKKGAGEYIMNFRPIALLPVIYKLYSRVLLILVIDWMQDLSPYQVAFRKGFQCGEVHYIRRSLIEKANEWNTFLPGHIYILDGDKHKAYDKTQHSVLLENAMRKGIEAIVIAAWVREIRRMSSVFELGKTRTRKIPRERSFIQGDPAAPYLFNMALDFVIRDFFFICKKRGRRYLVNVTSIPILVFAEFFWLIANSPTH